MPPSQRRMPAARGVHCRVRYCQCLPRARRPAPTVEAWPPSTCAREIREFLSTRRARITPEQAGLPAYGGNRRVKGLRREEVAMLAGVSVDYYVRMERGSLAGASESVLDALANALQARRGRARPPLRPGPRESAQSTSRRQPHAATPGAPGDPAGARRDDRRPGMGAQRSARHPRDEPAGPGALLAGARRPAPPGQHHPLRLPGPGRGARSSSSTTTRSPTTPPPCCASRPAATRTTRPSSSWSANCPPSSELFRQRWASQDVRFHRSGRKRLRHPAVGQLDLDFEALELPSEPGLHLNVYTAPAGTPTADALKLLASWAASEQSLPTEAGITK